MMQANVVVSGRKRATRECPECANELAVFPAFGRIEYRCTRRHGKFLKLSALYAWIAHNQQMNFELAMQTQCASNQACPHCRETMQISIFKTIPIEHCEKCRSAWLSDSVFSRLPLKSEAERFKAHDSPLRLEGNSDYCLTSPFSGICGGVRDPIATLTLIAICVVITKLFWNSEIPEFFKGGAVDPLRGMGAPLLLALFTHEDTVQLIANGSFLYFCGRALEHSLGWKRFAALFFACGIGGELVSTLSQGQSGLGTGGAISGLLLTLAYTQPRAKYFLRPTEFLPFFPSPVTVSFPIPLWAWFLLWFGWNLGGLQAELQGLGDGNAYSAHIGGALVGLVLTQLAYFRAAPARPKP